MAGQMIATGLLTLAMFFASHWLWHHLCRLRVRLFFAWYDLWVGAYWDRDTRTLYVCPVPTIGVAIEVQR